MCLTTEKVKEKERKWEKRKETRKTPAQDFINGEDISTVLVLGAFIAKPPLQITKIT